MNDAVRTYIFLTTVVKIYLHNSQKVMQVYLYNFRKKLQRTTERRLDLY